MPKPLTKAATRKAMRLRTKALRRAISAMDLVASGTLHRRTKSCGRAGCRCEDDVSARHGPYLEWTRRRDGRQALSVLTAHQAALVEEAIANRREIERLLAEWELHAEAVILGDDAKSL